MTEGKFLDIGRGVCQTCRNKTFKSLDFHDCPVVKVNELLPSEQPPGTSRPGYSGRLLQLPGQHAIMSPREEKPINLPMNPVPSIKIKSLAAIQPVQLNSTNLVRNPTQRIQPMRSEAYNIQPIRSESLTHQPIRSESLTHQPIRSVGENIQPMRSESLSLSMRSEAQNLHQIRSLGRNIGTATPQNYDNVRGKISELNSAISALNPSYRPLGFSITKLSDLGPSTLMETLTATHIAMETILSSIAPGQEKELWEAVLPFMTTKLINK
jgi:hypothetical protein